MEFALTYHVRIRLLSVGVLVALSLARAQSRNSKNTSAWRPMAPSPHPLKLLSRS
jgi:hypothetical protein